MSVLGLNRRSALRRLDSLSVRLPVYSDRGLNVVFENSIPVGHGGIRNFDDAESNVKVGIGGLSGDFVLSFVDDLQFIKAVVTLYHEYGHYLQNYGPDKNIQTIISEASVFGNYPYYNNHWRELPHEIAAEMTGVTMAWDAMSAMFSKEKADVCMLGYVNHKSSETSYILPSKQGGYNDRSEVETAFVSAMERSLHEPRTASGDFLRDTDNEYVRLLMQGKRIYTDSPNAYHVDKLIDTIPGSQKDRMLTSLVIHLHSDLLNDYPELKSENLTIEHEFGKPLDVGTLPDPTGTKIDKRGGALEMLQSMMSRDHEDDNVDDPEFGE